MKKIPNKKYIMKYHTITNDHEHTMSINARVTTDAYLIHPCTELVIFHIRCADPTREKGDDIIIFSDASLLLIGQVNFLFILYELFNWQGHGFFRYSFFRTIF